MVEAEIGMMCFKGRGRGCKPRNSGGLWELEEPKETNFPLKPSEGMQPDDNFILAQ